MNGRGVQRGWILPLGILSSLILAGPAAAVLGLPWWTIDNGGMTEAAGGTLRLGGTVGQPDTGTSSGGSLELLGGFWMGGQAAGAAPEEGAPNPAAFHLAAVGPSPFTGQTCLRLSLAESRHVKVTVYDSAGRLVRQLCDRAFAGGNHEIVLDARGETGRRLLSGVYHVRVEAGADRATRRVILLSE